MSQETERYQLENNGNTYLARASASGGGADVEANPEGTATTDLTKLKVDDTIYGIPDGNYPINTYQQNKTYTSADTDYEQLRDDITNHRPIRISMDIYSLERIIDGATPEYIYMTISPDANYTGNTILVQRISIVLGTSSVVITNVITATLNSIQDYSGAFSYNNSTGMTIKGVPYNYVAKENYYITTAPTANNTSGYLKFVVLTSEPATRYNGYLYIITA